MSTDRIEKRIALKAPISRVWRALTDYKEFGEWFRVKLEGPFVVGKVSRGSILYPGFEHVKWEALVQKMEPERLFSFTWPHARSLDKADYSPDYSNEPRTLVEFRWRRQPTGRCWCSRSPVSTNCRATGEKRRIEGTREDGRSR